MLALLLPLLLLPWSADVQAMTTFACEGNHVSISCPMPRTQVIIIRSAMYGRRTDAPGTSGRCGDNLVLRRKCEEDITQLMKFHCEGQPMCEVYVDIATFGTEFCVDIRKYAEVEYDCIQAYTMDTIKHCQQKCIPTAPPAPHPFGSNYNQPGSKTQIPGPASGTPTSNSVAPASGHGNARAPAASASASASARPSAAVPSPPRAPSSSSSSSSSPSRSLSSSSAKASIPSPPSAPALPYGNLSRSIAAALNRGSGNTQSTSGPGRINALRSAAVRANLMARMRRILIAIRNKKRG